MAELTDRVVDVEFDSGRARPLDEELLTLVRGERRNGPAYLAVDLNALAAGDEEPESRAGSKQAGEVVRKFRKKVFGVVQEQQDLLAEEGARYGIGKHLAPLLADLQRLRDHGQDERRVPERGKRDPEEAVGKAVGGLGGGLQGKPGLAGASRPGERE